MAQYFFKMTNEEKNNILNQHKTIYDGYVTEYGQQTNKQPLYVQDYANDKVGLVVSNKGVVKPYTNMGINESHTGLDMIGGDSHDQSEYKYRHLKNGTVDLDDYGFNSDNEEYPSPNEDEFEYISLGNINDDDGYDDYADEDYDDKFDKESQEIKRIERELGNINDDDDDSVDDYKNRSMYNPYYDEEEDELEEGFDDFKIMDLRGGVDYSEKEFPKSNKYKVNMSDINRGDTIDTFDDGNFNNLDFDFEEVDEDVLPEFMEKLHESIDMFRRFNKYN